MSRTPGLNISNGNTSLMTIRGTVGVFVLVLALLACSGCVQPDKTMVQVPVNTGMNSTGTSVPVGIPSPTLPGQTRIIPTPVTLLATTGPSVQATSPALPAGNREPGGFVRYTGADYSLDYPAAWSTNSTLLPLREYRHSQYDCSVTSAYNLDQELRMYYSRDGSTLFYSAVVNSERDIWPRTAASARVITRRPSITASRARTGFDLGDDDLSAHGRARAATPVRTSRSRRRRRSCRPTGCSWRG